MRDGRKMKNKFLSGFLLIAAALLLGTCGKQITEPVNEDNLSGNVTLKGQVIDIGSGSPLAYALVKILNDAEERSLFADSLGSYKTEITIEKAKEIKVIASKEGYRPDTTRVYVTAGKTFEVGLFKLKVTNYATLQGVVADRTTGNALSGAVVRVISASQASEPQTITDNQGKYSLTVPMDKNKQLYIIAVKEGYYPDTASVYAAMGRSIDVPLFRLIIRNAADVSSGDPASIYLVSQSAQSIGVKESGSIETASLVWEVQDSTGTPVDAKHAANVSFRIGITPRGGEYISPENVMTNALGRVAMNISSGTKAGVMQLIAEIKLPGKTILSKPVSIAIHGGLPDQTHFSIAPEKLNIPGYNYNGVIDLITAYAGDKYANPVRPKTAVYFTTDGAYIEGSALTNDMGLGTVKLISAEPRPVHPVLGKGFATITASTADENYHMVTGQTIVLFSGLPFLSVTPSTVDIPHLGSQTFYYTLKDQNDNPLSEGTAINVSVEGEKLKVTGDTNVRLPDTQSKSWTQFTFTVVSKDSTDGLKPVNISISTTGPNGFDKINISGVVR